MKNLFAKFSLSYLGHILVGSLIAIPIMFLTLYSTYIMALIPIPILSQLMFWLFVISIPSLIAGLLYRLRQHLSASKALQKGYIAYMLPSACAFFLTMALTLGYSNSILTHYAPLGGATMMNMTVLAGAIIGVVCLWLERKTLHSAQKRLH